MEKLNREIQELASRRSNMEPGAVWTRVLESVL